MSRIKLTDQADGVTQTPVATKKVIFSKSSGIYYKDNSGLEEKLIDDHDIAYVESIMNLSILYAGGF